MGYPRDLASPIALHSHPPDDAQNFPGEKSVFSVGVFNSILSPLTPPKKQGVFKVGGKLQNDFFKTLFHTAIAPFFRNFGLINIKNQPKH